jgi:hypothetical protein
MEYIGNRPPGNTGGYDPYDTGGYWWNYNNPYGAYDPYGYNTPVTSWEDQIRQSGGTAPTTPNEGQTVETPGGTDPGSFAPGTGDPTFTTEVIGNPLPPLDYTGSQIDPYLAEYLSSLPQVGGTGTGGGGANFSVTGSDFMDPSYPFPGEYPVEEWEPNPPPGTPTFKTDVWDTTDPDDPIKRGDYKTYWDFPTQLPDYKEPLQGWPDFTFTPNPPPGGTTTTRPPIRGPVITTPPRTTPGPTQPPQPQQPGGKQQQQPGVGKLLAALPMLAAFQGGTTTTPAPYAHLGPHTPVAPVFKPQGRGNPIPSIGQLLAGVR